FSIRGAVVDAQGHPLASARPLLVPSPNYLIWDSIPITTADDGTFALSGVAPGDYLIEGARSPCPGCAPSEVYASTSMTVVDRDVAGVTLRFGAGMGQIRGRILLPSGAPADLGPQRLHLVVRPIDISSPILTYAPSGAAAEATIAPDW